MLIPNYAWKPHKTTSLSRPETETAVFGSKNLQEVRDSIPTYAHEMIDRFLIHQINDVIYLSIYSELRDTDNLDVLGLARDRIPLDNTEDKTTSFLIALLYEKEIALPSLIEKLKNAIELIYGIYRLKNHDITLAALATWTRRADKIADITTTARAKVGKFAAYADFNRDWALVDLGEEIGVELTITGNSVKLDYTRDRILKTSDITINQSIKQVKIENVKLPPIRERNNQTDGITITSKNGANKYNIKDGYGNWGSDVTLNKDASKTFTVIELAYGVRTRPIALPTIYEEIADQSLNVGVVQTVSIETTFQGTLLTITVSSSDEDKVTVVVTEHGAGLAITGVAAGTATITVTATNPSGSISTPFDVTVTEPSGD